MKENITLTIKSITSTDKKKDGSDLIGKFGKYFIVKADTEEESYVTWFSKTAHTHKPGDKITGTLEIKTSEKDGKTYTNKNFSFPKKTDGIDPEAFLSLSKRVTTLELSFERKFEELKADLVFQLTGKFRLDKDVENQKPHPMAQPEPDSIPLSAYNEEDIPF